jgi:low affinity Fe/Cu permease
MSKPIYALADFMSTPAAFMTLTGGTMIAIAIGISLPVPDAYWTALNLAISVTTMAIGQAVLVSSARDNVAMHVKMDRIIEALPTENDAIGLEHKDAKTIEDERAAVEARAT